MKQSLDQALPESNAARSVFDDASKVGDDFCGVINRQIERFVEDPVEYTKNPHKAHKDCTIQ